MSLSTLEREESVRLTRVTYGMVGGVSADAGFWWELGDIVGPNPTYRLVEGSRKGLIREVHWDITLST